MEAISLLRKMVSHDQNEPRVLLIALKINTGCRQGCANIRQVQMAKLCRINWCPNPNETYSLQLTRHILNYLSKSSPKTAEPVGKTKVQLDLAYIFTASGFDLLTQASLYISKDMGSVSDVLKKMLLIF